jgi:hypothetical protein
MKWYLPSCINNSRSSLVIPCSHSLYTKQNKIGKKSTIKKKLVSRIFSVKKLPKVQKCSILTRSHIFLTLSARTESLSIHSRTATKIFFNLFHLFVIFYFYFAFLCMFHVTRIIRFAFFIFHPPPFDEQILN